MTDDITGALKRIEKIAHAVDREQPYADKQMQEIVSICKAIREAVNKIPHKLDVEIDQYHTVQWIWDLAYIAEQIVKVDDE